MILGSFYRSFLVVWVLLITGCGSGGGGGGGSTGPVTPPPPTNQSPTVELGSDVSVLRGNTVLLTAQASDSDGNISSYQWQQVSGTQVTLSSNNEAQVSFIAPMVDELSILKFSVEVTDDKGAKANDDVTVTVEVPGIFAAAQSLSNVTQAALWYPVDFDNDNDVDLVGSFNHGKQLGLVHNIGGGQFSGISAGHDFIERQIHGVYELADNGKKSLIFSQGRYLYQQAIDLHGQFSLVTPFELRGSTIEYYNAVIYQAWHNDLNNDGVKDLFMVLHNEGDNTTYYSAFINVGDGSFDKESRVYSNDGLTTIHQLHDYNDDGQIDLVWYDGSEIKVMNGPLFEPNNSVETVFSKAEVTALTFADINNDQVDDLVVATNEVKLWWLAADGQGAYSAPEVLIDDLTNISQLMIKDINNDGHNDILTAGHTLSYFINQGLSDTATFEPAVKLNTFNSEIAQINQIDVDNDGDSDVIVNLVSDGANVWFENTTKLGSNALTQSISIANTTHTESHSLSNPLSDNPLQLNADRFSLTLSSMAEVSLAFEGNFDGTMYLYDEALHLLGTAIQSNLNTILAAGQYYLDVTANADNSGANYSLNVQLPSGAQWNKQQQPLTTDSAASLLDGHDGFELIAETDVNGDGRLDWLAQDGLNGILTWFARQADGSYERQNDIDDTFYIGVYLRVADINGDDKDDIVVFGSHRSPRKAGIWYNLGGSFDFEQLDLLPITVSVNVADTNNDGQADLVVGGEKEPNVLSSTVFLQSNGVFSQSLDLATAPGTGTYPQVDVQVRDTDGDQDLDVISKLGSSTIVVSESKGENQWQHHVLESNQRLIFEDQFVDFDNDGDLDWVTRNWLWEHSNYYNIDIRINQGNMQFSPWQTLASSVFLEEHWAFFDINSDGWPELVTNTYLSGSPQLRIYSNQQGISLATPVVLSHSFPTYVQSGAFALPPHFGLTDFDGNGSKDLYLGSSLLGFTNVYPNPLPGLKLKGDSEAKSAAYVSITAVFDGPLEQIQWQQLSGESVQLDSDGRRVGIRLPYTFEATEVSIGFSAVNQFGAAVSGEHTIKVLPSVGFGELALHYEYADEQGWGKLRVSLQDAPVNLAEHIAYVYIDGELVAVTEMTERLFDLYVGEYNVEIVIRHRTTNTIVYRDNFIFKVWPENFTPKLSLVNQQSSYSAGSVVLLRVADSFFQPTAKLDGQALLVSELGAGLFAIQLPLDVSGDNKTLTARVNGEPFEFTVNIIQVPEFDIDSTIASITADALDKLKAQQAQVTEPVLAATLEHLINHVENTENDLDRYDTQIKKDDARWLYIVNELLEQPEARVSAYADQCSSSQAAFVAQQIKLAKIAPLAYLLLRAKANLIGATGAAIFFYQINRTFDAYDQMMDHCKLSEFISLAGELDAQHVQSKRMESLTEPQVFFVSGRKTPFKPFKVTTYSDEIKRLVLSLKMTLKYAQLADLTALIFNQPIESLFQLERQQPLDLTQWRITSKRSDVQVEVDSHSSQLTLTADGQNNDGLLSGKLTLTDQQGSAFELGYVLYYFADVYLPEQTFKNYHGADIVGSLATSNAKSVFVVTEPANGQFTMNSQWPYDFTYQGKERFIGTDSVTLRAVGQNGDEITTKLTFVVEEETSLNNGMTVIVNSRLNYDLSPDMDLDTIFENGGYMVSPGEVAIEVLRYNSTVEKQVFVVLHNSSKRAVNLTDIWADQSVWSKTMHVMPIAPGKVGFVLLDFSSVGIEGQTVTFEFDHSYTETYQFKVIEKQAHPGLTISATPNYVFDFNSAQSSVSTFSSSYISLYNTGNVHLTYHDYCIVYWLECISDQMPSIKPGGMMQYRQPYAEPWQFRISDVYIRGYWGDGIESVSPFANPMVGELSILATPHIFMVEREDGM